MKIVSTSHFYVDQSPRVVHPGEMIDVSAENGRELVKQGMAVTARKYPEMAVRVSRERAVAIARPVK